MAFHHLEFRHKNICEAWGNRLARKGRVYVHLYIQRGLVEVSIHAWCDFFCWESSLRFVRFFLLDLIEERAGLCVRKKREGGGGGWKGVEGSALECLSTSALRPSAETGTLWEQACSGVFYVQCMEGELRGQIASSNWNTSGLLGCLVFSTRLTHYLWFPPFLAFILCLTSTAMTVLFWADSCATLG